VTLHAMDPLLLLLLVCDGWALLQRKVQESMGLLLAWETLLLSHLALNWLDYSMGHSIRHTEFCAHEFLWCDNGISLVDMVS
jgi:hypothetical protein